MCVCVCVCALEDTWEDTCLLSLRRRKAPSAGGTCCFCSAFHLTRSSTLRPPLAVPCLSRRPCVCVCTCVGVFLCMCSARGGWRPSSASTTRCVASVMPGPVAMPLHCRSGRGSPPPPPPHPMQSGPIAAALPPPPQGRSPLPSTGPTTPQLPAAAPRGGVEIGTYPAVPLFPRTPPPASHGAAAAPQEAEGGAPQDNPLKSPRGWKHLTAAGRQLPPEVCCVCNRGCGGRAGLCVAA